MAVLGCALLLISAALPYRERPPALEWMPWLATAFGMLAVGLDERFQIHETVRGRWIRPTGIGDALGWLNPGDIVMVVYPLFALTWTHLWIGLGKRVGLRPKDVVGAIAFAVERHLDGIYNLVSEPICIGELLDGVCRAYNLAPVRFDPGLLRSGPG